LNSKYITSTIVRNIFANFKILLVISAALLLKPILKQMLELNKEMSIQWLKLLKFYYRFFIFMYFFTLNFHIILRPSYQTSSSNHFRCHFDEIAVTFQYSTVATLFHFSTFWNNKKSFFTNKFLFTIFKVVIHIFVIYRSPLVYKYLGLSICCQRSRKPSMKLEYIFWMFVLWILYWTRSIFHHR